MRFEFSRQIFGKGSSMKFNKNLPIAVELFHVDGQTERET